MGEYSSFLENNMTEKKPSLNQLSSLLEIIKEDEALNKHWELDDQDDVWDKLKELSLGQYKYLLYLLSDKERAKLNAFFLQKGFRRK